MMKQEEAIRVLERLRFNAEKNLYAFLLPEHILAAILEEPRFHKIAAFCNADEKDIKEIVTDLIESQEKVSKRAEVMSTQDYKNIIKAWCIYAQAHSYEIRIEHMLWALLANSDESVAAYALAKNNITKDNLKRFIESDENHKVVKGAVNLNNWACKGKFEAFYEYSLFQKSNGKCY